MKKLPALITELESKLPHCEKLNVLVSQASVGWHIQHSLLVGLKIIRAVEKSNPANFRPKFNLSRLFVFTLHHIPRGKGKAPAIVIPETALNAKEMEDDFQLLKSRIGVLEKLQPDNYFTHHVFGDLNVKGSIKMLQIHTKHHIDIINDIIRS